MCETPTVFNAKAARARKRYCCDECDASIEPDEIYESAFGVWSGRAETYRTCEPCWEIREDLREDMNEHSSGGLDYDEIACALAYGRLAEELAEHCAEMNL